MRLTLCSHLARARARSLGRHSRTSHAARDHTCARVPAHGALAFTIAHYIVMAVSRVLADRLCFRGGGGDGKDRKEGIEAFATLCLMTCASLFHYILVSRQSLFHPLAIILPSHRRILPIRDNSCQLPLPFHLHLSYPPVPLLTPSLDTPAFPCLSFFRFLCVANLYFTLNWIAM